MLVAHLFLKPGSQPILIAQQDTPAEGPPFLALEALIAAGFTAAQALRILSARRPCGGRTAPSDACRRTAEHGSAGRHGYRPAQADARPAERWPAER